jgi:hypothetical protein
MKNYLKFAIIGIISSVVTTWILTLIFGWVLNPWNIGGAVISGLIGAAIFVHFLDDDSLMKEPAEQQSAGSQSATETKGFGRVLEQLIELNQFARLSLELSGEQVERVEQTIDTALSTMDIMSEKGGSNPLSFEVSRIAGFWLIDHVIRYVRMSVSAREGGAAEFLKALDDMSKSLEDTASLIKQGNMIEYAANLAMIQMKYNKGA